MIMIPTTHIRKKEKLINFRDKFDLYKAGSGVRALEAWPLIQAFEANLDRYLKTEVLKR